MKTRVCGAALLFLLGCQQPELAAGAPLTMTVFPAYSYAPATVRVTVRIEPNADNRALEVAVDSGGFYRSSHFQLEGERAERTMRLEFRDLPGGEYEVRGTLLDGNERERACVSSSVTVLSQM